MSHILSSADQDGQRSRDEDASRLADGISEYEMERRRTMERNHRRLQELGLVGQGKVAMSETALKTTRRGPRTGATSAAAPVAVAVRKSLRTRSRPAPVYTDNSVGFDDETKRGKKKRPRTPLVGLQGLALQSPPPIASSPGPRRTASKPLPPDSSRNLECDIAMLMEHYLGRRFHSFGKAPVMELSTKSCPPRFSRMSGVTEWKNAVFLWVNVDGGTSYENLFEGNLDVLALAGNGDLSKPLIGNAGATAKSPPEAPTKSGEEKVIGKVTQVPDGRPLEETGDARRCRSSPRVAGASSAGCGAGRDAAEDAPGNLGHGAAAGDDARGGGVGGPAPLRMTWFAGGRMTAESALIQRLLLQRRPLEAQERGFETLDTAYAKRTKLDRGKATVSHDAVLEETDDAGKARKTDSARSTTAESLGGADKPRGSSTPTPRGDLDAGDNGLGAPGDVSADGAARLLHADAVNDAVIEGPFPESTQSAQQPGDGNGGPEADMVLLFCRLPNEPYVYCGRLGYSKHWSAERPVRFVWRLLDAARLAGYPDFRAIVAAAGIGNAPTTESSKTL